MRERFGHGEYTQSKAQGVAAVLKRLLFNLVLRCAKSEGVRDYFYVAVIGYGHPVGTLFGGALAGKDSSLLVSSLTILCGSCKKRSNARVANIAHEQ